MKKKTIQKKTTTTDSAKGVPKRDGSGKGVGANSGRGGCKPATGKNQR